MADAIDCIYKGDSQPTSLTRKKVSVKYFRDYNQNFFGDIPEKFTICDNERGSEFIVVDNKYLFLNFYKFNNFEDPNFKAYSDIAGLSKCFDLISGNRKVNANNQKIKKLIPAEVHVENGQFVLDKKGEIYLED